MKVTICFFGETPIYKDIPIDGDTRGDFRSHNEEVFVHAGMDDLHRRLVAGVAVTAAPVSAILNVNRECRREISLAVSSKDRRDRADRIASRIVSDITSKEKTTKQVSFADGQVDTMQDVSMTRPFLSKNRHSNTTAEELIKRWGIIMS